MMIIPMSIIFASVLAYSRDDKLVNRYFSYFSQKTGYDISGKVSALETLFVRSLILFLGKSISICYLLKSLPRVLSVKNTCTNFRKYNEIH